MAAVTTTINDAGVPENWATDRRDPNMPIGSHFYNSYASGDAIAIKGAGDEMTVNITLTLPRNYFWRASFLEVLLIAPAIVDLENYSKAARVRLSPNGATSGQFFLFNQMENATAGAEPGTKMDAAGVTNDFGALFAITPGILETELVDATSPVANTVLVSLFDVVAGATAAMTVFYRARFWQYTIEQANLGAVYKPTLVV